MKLKKYFFTILFSFLFFLIINSTRCYAGDLELRNLKYDVKLNSDGSANVTESWDIRIEDTNTLFKTFEIDKAKYSGITDVSLIETTDGKNKEFRQIFKEQYHVDRDCFYALVNSKGKFEVAWGVHEDDSYARRSFNMNYTIVDAVKNYNDASEFYWQFLNTSSAIPARKVTGTVTLPTNVIVKDDFRVWAHGPLNGNIYKTSDNTATFEIENLKSKTMLEVRVVTPTYVFEENKNVSYQNKLSEILSQEQKWADEANRKRELEVRRQKFKRFLYAVIIILTNIGGIFLCKKLIKKNSKYKEELQNAPDINPETPSKYFRDIPNDVQTPAQAAFLYYFKKTDISLHIPDVISATILDLCLKNHLTFEVLEDKKNQIKIKLNLNKPIDSLSKDEVQVYKMLDKVSSNKEFTMKEFEKYAKNHSTSFMNLYEKIKPSAQTELEEQKSYDKNYISKSSNYSTTAFCYLLLAGVSIIFMIAAVIPCIICAITLFKLAKRYNTLTQKGANEKEAWNGLKNFMEDFSMLDKKEVPELVLWEKYLVYATAFGISDKVLKQLKVVYPQITDKEFMNSHGYTYLYYMSYNNFSNSFIHSINTSVTNSYKSVNYSSGSGSGGGFSGGGGFGGGGGRNGRKIKC